MVGIALSETPETLVFTALFADSLKRRSWPGCWGTEGYLGPPLCQAKHSDNVAISIHPSRRRAAPGARRSAFVERETADQNDPLRRNPPGPTESCNCSTS